MSSYNERIAIKQKESNMKEKWYGSQRGGVGGGVPSWTAKIHSMQGNQQGSFCLDVFNKKL